MCGLPRDMTSDSCCNIHVDSNQARNKQIMELVRQLIEEGYTIKSPSITRKHPYDNQVTIRRQLIEEGYTIKSPSITRRHPNDNQGTIRRQLIVEDLVYICSVSLTQIYTVVSIDHCTPCWESALQCGWSVSAPMPPVWPTARYLNHDADNDVGP